MLARRLFLSRTALCALGASVGFGSHRLLSQQPSPRVDNDIMLATKSANDLLNEVIDAEAPLRPTDYKILVEREYRLRVSLTNSLSQISTEEQFALVLPRHHVLANTLAEHDTIPLVFPVEQVAPSEIADLQRIADEPDCDMATAVLWICLDAVGLREHKELIVELIADTPVQSVIQDLVDGFPEKDWRTVAGQLVDVVLVLAGSEFLVRLRREAGKQIADAMIRRFSLSLVPFVGEVYIVIVIVAAIKKNWAYLTC